MSATAMLRGLAHGQRVRLVFDEPQGRIADRYGRLLASVYVDGQEVAGVMLKAGADKISILTMVGSGVTNAAITNIAKMSSRFLLAI